MADPDHSFPRAVRLTEKRDFDAVFRHRARTFRAPPIRILGKPNRMRTARLGLVVAKRVIPKAHDRNRIKRTLRESFRRQRESLPPWDLVVQLTQPGSPLQAKTAFERLLRKLKEQVADDPARTRGNDDS